MTGPESKLSGEYSYQGPRFGRVPRFFRGCKLELVLLVLDKVAFTGG
jgi:hypothetical protein